MIKTRNELKQYFLTGKKPTQQEFHNMLDSLLHQTDKFIAELPQGLESTDSPLFQDIFLASLQDSLLNTIIKLQNTVLAARGNATHVFQTLVEMNAFTDMVTGDICLVAENNTFYEYDGDTWLPRHDLQNSVTKAIPYPDRIQYPDETITDVEHKNLTHNLVCNYENKMRFVINITETVTVNALDFYTPNDEIYTESANANGLTLTIANNSTLVELARLNPIVLKNNSINRFRFGDVTFTPGQYLIILAAATTPFTVKLQGSGSEINGTPYYQFWYYTTGENYSMMRAYADRIEGNKALQLNYLTANTFAYINANKQLVSKVFVPENIYYQTLYNSLTTLAQRRKLKVTDAFTITDDAANDTTIFDINANDFNSIFFYTGSTLNLESNWSNNISLVDMQDNVINFIINELGCKFFAFGVPSGWYRFFVDASIKTTYTNGNTLRNQLIAADWSTIDTFTATYGDVGMWYKEGGWKYECIGSKVWTRVYDGSTRIKEFDADIQRKQIVYVLYDNQTFTLPAGAFGIIVIAEGIATTAGNLTIGTADGISDVVGTTAIPTVIGTKKRLSFAEPETQLNADTTYYANVDTAAQVKIYIKYELVK